jgi:hypothetical protein
MRKSAAFYLPFYFMLRILAYQLQSGGILALEGISERLWKLL